MKKMKKMYMWILILVGVYLIYKFVIKSGSTSTNTSIISGSEPIYFQPYDDFYTPPDEEIYTPPYDEYGCFEIINPITKRKEIRCPV